MVTIDEVLEALAALDSGPKDPPGGKSARTKSTSRFGLAAEITLVVNALSNKA
jgi:hypothetical protein